MSARWQFSIDRGGTFTDIVGRTPTGELRTLKLLSDNPDRYADAAVAGIRRMLGIGEKEPIDSAQVEWVKMGTTVATNALLERRGERTVLVITRGFRDALRIANQARPRLFDRRILRHELLYERVIEVDERVGASGEILVALDTGSLADELRVALSQGIRSCAIVLVHGYRFTAHESAIETLARDLGFGQVSVSHRVSPLVKLVPRGDTTVVDAYLSPVLRRYVDAVAGQMPGVRLLFMQSSGALIEASRLLGKDSILSGPAGGIVGMVKSAIPAVQQRLIGFDMGGTSTDVSHYAGVYERSFDTEVAGVRIRAPMMNIHTIAAGGGSIIRFDGTRLRVGPESAGANPGPCCYRRGGPLTITDANLILGRVQSEYFPAVFGASASERLDAAAALRQFAMLAAEVTAATGQAMTPEELAAGSLRVAVGSMANAVKRISVARGYDVTRYTLQCFGGAGGQHACLVADALGIERITCHAMAGVLSAFGMGVADQAVLREASIELVLNDEGLAQARSTAATLIAEAMRELELQGIAASRIDVTQRLLVRYGGTDTALPCEFPAATSQHAIRDEFEQAYRRRFAFLMPHLQLVIEAVAVECGTAALAPQARAEDNAPEYSAQPRAHIRTFNVAEGETGWQESGLYVRDELSAGAVMQGPAVIVERNATTVLEPGWRACVTGRGDLRLYRAAKRNDVIRLAQDIDPALLEIFNNLFMNIAEQMGLRLQSTAHSVNIKERLDFSCALFDASGALIANAPHMPVHLGSMSDSIRSVRERNPGMKPGDVFALNNPFHGGTHLPDVTVVTPVFLGALTVPDFFVASRGHHADVGGITPGSMPPFSTDIGQEGVLIDNFKLMEGGEFRERSLLDVLASGAYPARNPSQNLADLRAQIAANEKGVEELNVVMKRYGKHTLVSYVRHVQNNAEECVRRAISGLRDGEFELALDNGARIRVAVSVDLAKRAAKIDFTGTSDQVPNNFNAPRAITIAAVLYVFRTLVDDDIPLNAGCLKPLEIVIPDGCMLNPHWPAAVVAGNVETSMCVTNALYGALRTMAASQCTMNNFTFGNDRYQYYETLAGGSGAGPGFAGASVVQTHMTNSRLTDAEVLETRYPVRVDSYAIRRNSGGEGRWRGGDGGIRRIRFLEPMTAAILSNGRSSGAFGMAGGSAGVPGANHVERADGRVEPLRAIDEVTMAAGDIFVITTPGGGGYGVPGRGERTHSAATSDDSTQVIAPSPMAT